jgi:hypothetical protein
MITRADIGVTKHGEPSAQLSIEDSGAIILKAYVNPEGDKIRIVLPELENFTQTLINPDKHFLEFDRNPKRKK